MDVARTRRGLTLIELLVVAVVVGLLAAVALPALSRARAAARNAACQNNLRQIGIGLHLFAQHDPNSRLCTGAHDHARDGCMDTWGWVADVVNLSAADAAALRCPASPLPATEKLLDAYGISTADSLDRLVGIETSRYRDGICGAASWSGLAGSGSTGGFASTDPQTEERAQLIARYFIEQGFSTNYASSWFLVRTAPRVRFEPADNSIRTNGQAAQQGLKGLRGTLGPLTERVLASARVPTSAVPLLGDAAPGDLDEAIAPRSFEYAAGDPFANGRTASKVFIRRGELLSESINEGPAYYSSSSKMIRRIGSYNSRLETQWQCELSGTCRPPTGGSGNRMYLQSTLGWMTLHGGGWRRSANLLFADGSVRQFADQNNDGFLNPGFPVPDDLTPDQYARLGYRDSTVDLPPARCFSGVFLAPHSIKGVLR